MVWYLVVWYLLVCVCDDELCVCECWCLNLNGGVIVGLVKSLFEYCLGGFFLLYFVVVEFGGRLGVRY